MVSSLSERIKMFWGWICRLKKDEHLKNDLLFEEFIYSFQIQINTSLH